VKEARSGDYDLVEGNAVDGLATRHTGWRRDFPSIFPLTQETEEAPNDARLVMVGFLRRPRNLTMIFHHQERLLVPILEV